MIVPGVLMIARLVVAAMCLLCFGAEASAADEAVEEAAIREVIARMEAAWNRGDFHGYMEGFASVLHDAGWRDRRAVWR